MLNGFANDFKFCNLSFMNGFFDRLELMYGRLVVKLFIERIIFNKELFALI